MELETVAKTGKTERKSGILPSPEVETDRETPVHPILQLQQTIGNMAVQRLVRTGMLRDINGIQGGDGIRMVMKRAVGKGYKPALPVETSVPPVPATPQRPLSEAEETSAPVTQEPDKDTISKPASLAVGMTAPVPEIAEPVMEPPRVRPPSAPFEVPVVPAPAVSENIAKTLILPVREAIPALIAKPAPSVPPVPAMKPAAPEAVAAPSPITVPEATTKASVVVATKSVSAAEAPAAPPKAEAEVTPPAPSAAVAVAVPAATAPAGGVTSVAVPSGATSAVTKPEAEAKPKITGEAKPEGAVPEEAAKTGAIGEKSPASAEEDPAFQQMVGRAKGVAARQKAHVPAAAKSAEAQAAAVGPSNEVSSKAAAGQVQEMDQQQPKPFNRVAFKAALMQKIAAITPKNLEEADKFKESGKVAAMKGDLTAKVSEGKEQAQGDIAQKTEEAPDTSGIQPKPVMPLMPVDAGPAPSDVGASQAAPKPKTASEVSLQEGSNKLDKTMADEDVTEEQLTDANEPGFQGAVDAKKTAQTDAVQAPQAYRQDEQAVLGQAQAESQATAQTQLQVMHKGRGQIFERVSGQQVDTKSKDEQERIKVADHVQGIYETTKKKVEDRLKQLDDGVNNAFDQGAANAQQTFENSVQQRMDDYKDRRYGQIGGALLWAKDKLVGMPDEVNRFYEEGRDLYTKEMDAVLDNIATLVETGLNEAKTIITQGRQEIQDYVNSLPLALQEVGQKAAQDIQSKFDALERGVNDKQGQLIESLAQKYVANLQKVDERINEMKASNSGLVDAAIDAVKGVINTIKELKNMLLNVLSRVADAIGYIIKHPIKFLGNLVAGVKLGLNNFMGKLGHYLQEGLMKWLFGALAEAGIQMPETFDLKGILSLVLQVLGLTPANIRARAVTILGEKVVSNLEQAAEIFKILITEGPAGLWEYIKEKVGDLKTMVIDQIKSFVMERIIIAGITWIIGLLNPASAFIKACKAIYDIVMFFVERGRQILDLVNAVIDSVTAIAQGAINVAANFVEKALARAVPVVIGFLAALLGLGGISEKIKSVIDTIRKPINAAIDWVIKKAVDLVKAAGKLFGVGKKEEEKPPETQDPEHDLKVEAGLAAIDEEEKSFITEGKISREEAEKVAAKVKAKHPIFKSITVVEGEDRWDYEYVASKGKKKGEKKEIDEDEEYKVGTHTVPKPDSVKKVKGESHHVPAKVLQNWIGEILEVAGTETEDEKLKADGVKMVNDKKGEDLSAIWLSEKNHDAAHEASASRPGDFDTTKNEIIVQTREGRVSSRPLRTTIASSVYESTIGSEGSTADTRKKKNIEIYQKFSSKLRSLFRRVFSGLLRTGVEGLKNAKLKDTKWENAIKDKAEDTWKDKLEPKA